jgi:hypothetical protein
MSARRLGLYFSWNRTDETGIEYGQLDNRYPALFELRRAFWPGLEPLADADQGVAGFLDRIVLADFERFRQVTRAVTGHEVPLIQRVSATTRLLDPTLLDHLDTLIVISLDHLRTRQEAQPEEIAAVTQFLSRENACLVVCPHHYIGDAPETGARLEELEHHGDRLVPSQQLIGGFARSLLRGLNLPVLNRYGLRPAAAPDGSPELLQRFPDLDRLDILNGVSVFNLHPHLPHLDVPPESASRFHVLARQSIDTGAKSHPFVTAGNAHFNALLWAPPHDRVAGQVLICDATLWSSAFGGLASLEQFWKNIAQVPK